MVVAVVVVVAADDGDALGAGVGGGEGPGASAVGFADPVVPGGGGVHGPGGFAFSMLRREAGLVVVEEEVRKEEASWPVGSVTIRLKRGGASLGADVPVSGWLCSV